MCSLAVFVKKFLSFLQLRRIHVEVNGAGTGPWGWEDGVEGIADNTAADAVGAEHPSTMEASRMFPYCANIVIVKKLKLYHCVFDSKNAENEGKVYGDAKSREQKEH